MNRWKVSTIAIACVFVVAVVLLSYLFISGQSKLHSTQDELTANKAALDSTENELTDTEAQLKGTQDELSNTQDTLSETESSLDNTNSTLNQTKSTLEDVQNELDSTKSELQDTKEKLSDAQTELFSTQTQLTTSQSNARQLTQDLNSYKSLYEDSKKYKEIVDGLGITLHGSADNSDAKLVDNPSATDPTLAELQAFLRGDTTELHPYIAEIYDCSQFSQDLHNNAEAAGIRCGVVHIEMPNPYFYNDPEYNWKHAFNCFMTTDYGLIYVDDTGGPDCIGRVEVGKRYLLADISNGLPQGLLQHLRDDAWWEAWWDSPQNMGVAWYLGTFANVLSIEIYL
jgi:peptidoglycan hydrolase CwlO-like protein